MDDDSPRLAAMPLLTEEELHELQVCVWIRLVRLKDLLGHTRDPERLKEWGHSHNITSSLLTAVAETRYHLIRMGGVS
jgi:hypothetical protein